MNIPYTIVMDLARTHVTSSILIMEEDTNSRTVHLVMMNNGSPLNLSNIVMVQMKGISEADKVVYEESATIVLDGEGRKTNVIEYTLPDDITDHENIGLHTFTATLFDSDPETGVPNAQITTPEFYVRVKPQLYDLSERLSRDYWDGSGTDPGSGQGQDQEDDQESGTAAGRAYCCTCETADFEPRKVIMCDDVIDMQTGTVLFVHMAEGNTLAGDEIEGFDLDGDVYPIADDYPELWVNTEEHDLLLVYDGDVLRNPNFRRATTDQYGLAIVSGNFDEGDDDALVTLGAVRDLHDMVQDLQQSVYFTACSSDADDPEKELNLGDVDLEAGAVIYVDFTEGNTVPGDELEGIIIGEETYPVADTEPDPWICQNRHIATLVYDGESFLKANYNPSQRAILSEYKDFESTSQRVSLSSGSNNAKNIVSVTAPFTGYAMVSGYVQMDRVSSSESGTRHASILVGGTTIGRDVREAVVDNSTALSVSACCACNVGDVITLRAWQGSGHTLHAGGRLNVIFTEA